MFVERQTSTRRKLEVDRWFRCFFRNWQPNEPNNNTGGGAHGEDYLQFVHGWDSATWNDISTLEFQPGIHATTKGIAEIDLGSDFGVATSANLTVNPVNDDATGEPLIEIHGDPADEIQHRT